MSASATPRRSALSSGGAVAFLSLAISGEGSDAAHPSLAEVLAANPAVPVACGYTLSAFDPARRDGPRVERFSVGADGAMSHGTWRLVSLNNAPPSAKALRAYAREARARRRRDHPIMDLATYVRGEAATVRVEGDALVYTFTPGLGKLNFDPEKTRGTLIVSKAGLRARRLAIEVTESHSPGPTVTMQEFQMAFNFATEKATGALLVMSRTVQARAKVLFVKKIESDYRGDFSEFDCQPLAAGARASG